MLQFITQPAALATAAAAAAAAAAVAAAASALTAGGALVTQSISCYAAAAALLLLLLLLIAAIMDNNRRSIHEHINNQTSIQQQLEKEQQKQQQQQQHQWQEQKKTKLEWQISANCASRSTLHRDQHRILTELISTDSPHTFHVSSLKQRIADDMAYTTMMHFTWNIPELRELTSLQELESKCFTDASVPGAGWKIRAECDPASARLLISLLAVQLGDADTDTGRMFLEVNCFCEGMVKATFSAMRAGMSEPLLWLHPDTLLLSQADNQQPVSITCILIVYNSIALHCINTHPASSLDLVEGFGQHAEGECARVNWIIDDWSSCAWEPGLAVFSPLFSLHSLPSYLWQLHIYPNSDCIDFAGSISFFLKLVDCPTDAALLPVEADMQLTVNGDEFFDTVEFIRGSTHGFRDSSHSHMNGNQLRVQCEMQIKSSTVT